jgi:lipoyl(octanoyl) transferase
VTYHGPGQITAYILIDLKRAEMSVFELISVIEKTVINTMSKWKVPGYTDRLARGVYCKSRKKIASIGLRVRRGCTYHGISFNVDMDMSPWKSINACGLDLEMTQLKNETNDYVDFNDVLFTFKKELIKELGYNDESENIVDNTSL